jgi:hypothetical protein
VQTEDDVTSEVTTVAPVSTAAPLTTPCASKDDATGEVTTFAPVSTAAYVECDLSDATDVHVTLDLFASEFGHYVVDGCEGVAPTLILEAGKEYTFHQQDISNWFHPLGFAYYPNGALVGADELEPSVAKEGNDQSCVATESCDSPRYYIGDEYLGGESGDGGFGLDLYEPVFATVGARLSAYLNWPAGRACFAGVSVTLRTPCTHSLAR